jgi:anion transporter
MSATASAAIAKPAATRKWGWLAVATLTGIAVALAPTPSGLTATGQTVLAIMLFMVIIWATQVIQNGLASILMMGLLVLAGVKPASALNGFSGSSLWLVLCVLFYGLAMQRTGIAQRVAYYLLSLFPLTYPGILTAFFAIGVALSVGIPSMTVRTAIMVPIAWALVRSLGLAPRSRGSALIMITTVEMAVIPGCALIYGSLYGPVVLSIFQSKHLPISWAGYAAVFLVPTMLLCILVILANMLVLRPEAPLKAPPGLVRDKLQAMGSIKRDELLTSGVVLGSMLLWATDKFHHQPAFLIGILGLLVLSLTGVLHDSDIQSGISWNLVLFLGGVFGLANVIQEQKIPEWLASYLIPIAKNLAASPLLVLLAISIGMFAVKFLDPSGFVAIPVMFLPIVDIAGASGLPPLITMAAVVLAAMPFWLSYQNIWIAMCEGMTADDAFSSGQRLRLAGVYAIAVLTVVALSLVYWRAAGLA